MTDTMTEATHGVNLSDDAAAKVRSLLEQEGFDERLLDGDAVRDFDGVEVVVDKMSAPYLDGASIDFADTIEQQGFTIDNPNAGGSCACGDSFH
jgi:iron-sulfur cluster assembly accessory protein